MPKFTVEKSIVIDAPIDKVYATVRDFRQWPAWSPWLIVEPDCQVTYADDGNSYAWEGKIVGRGEMVVTGEEAQKSIDYKLTFLKPYKSKADVRFSFAEESGDGGDGGVKVTWSMDSSLPVFFFWMKTMMIALIGMDYQRGLGMLKDEVETGAVPSKLEFLGQHPVAGVPYAGVRSQCSLHEVGPSMQKEMVKLQKWFEENDVPPAGMPFTMYHRWDMAKCLVDYTMAFPVPDPSAPALSKLPAGFVFDRLPACNAYVVKHTGPYRHLGNAWTAGTMHRRAKVYHEHKEIDPWEVYENDPVTTPENDLVAMIHFPVK